MKLHLIAASALLATMMLQPRAVEAQTIPDACVEALAADAMRWDGIPMDPFTWDGVVTPLGEIDLEPISLCGAGGPLEILPPSQRIGCVLVGAFPGLVGDQLACGAYREVRLLPDGALMWIARSSAATNEVSVFPWNGFGFDPAPSYVACWDDPTTPITDPTICGR